VTRSKGRISKSHGKRSPIAENALRNCRIFVGWCIMGLVIKPTSGGLQVAMLRNCQLSPFPVLRFSRIIWEIRFQILTEK